MKNHYGFMFMFGLVIALALNINAQNHGDPAYLQIVSAENPVTIDGVLDESDWLKRYDYLVFGQYALAGDVTYTVTDSAHVKGETTDSTLTFVKIIHYGLDLYISLQSNDQSVGKFGNSWEGDGLFMKIKSASGIPYEYKLFFNQAGVDPDIAFETNGPEGSGEGAAFKNPGTIVNDISQVDDGYTAEMVIHLDMLGYTDPYADVEAAMVIFDPDGYTDDMDPWGDAGSYFKSWWGSEWGSEFRILRLSDKPMVVANKTDDVLDLDGELTEPFWSEAESIEVGKGSHSGTGGYYMQWNSPTNVYDDQSMATVKFAHNGTDLYIGVESDDASVCKWSPGWEADGLFLWMTNKGEIPDAGSRMEIKNMFFDATEGAKAVFEMNGNVPSGGAEGACYLPEGTVTHTETNGPDAGYSLEVVVHTDMFGYEVGDEVSLSVVIWDLDYASADAWTDSTSDYAPNWWGSQWVDPTFEKYHMYRKVLLSFASDVEEIGTTVSGYKLKQNYPNPFSKGSGGNSTTKISYSIPSKEYVTLKIYDAIGREISTLVNQEQNRGVYEATFDASRLSSGVYFYTLKAGNYVQTKKMMLLK
ncbi:MAG: T9SS type A sorting domain-containing protein [Chlorobi bacterium]|nr:T9SS type A sorting domain-containing protein [Chlorobiota bacterium]